MPQTASFILLENTAITANGTGPTNPVGASGVQKASLYVSATLGGTTPDLVVFLQTRDPAGNWHDLGSGIHLTATGVAKEVGIAGPFGDAFRYRAAIDLTDTNETYAGVDISIVLEL